MGRAKGFAADLIKARMSVPVAASLGRPLSTRAKWAGGECRSRRRWWWTRNGSPHRQQRQPRRPEAATDGGGQNRAGQCEQPAANHWRAELPAWELRYLPTCSPLSTPTKTPTSLTHKTISGLVDVWSDLATCFLRPVSTPLCLLSPSLLSCGRRLIPVVSLVVLASTSHPSPT
jgi:hypothetical protein